MAYQYAYEQEDVDRQRPRCSFCENDSFVIVQCEGEVVCDQCGTVMESRMMVDDSVNLFTPDDGGVNPNQRHGCPIIAYMQQTSLSTRIGYGGKLSKLARRLHQNNSMPSCERTFHRRFKALDAILNNLRIESQIVSERANSIWADLRAKNVMAKGDNNRALMACCVYYACKLCDFQKTPEDVMEAAGVEQADKFSGESKRVIAALVNAPYFDLLIKDTQSDVNVPMFVNMLRLGGRTHSWPLVKETREVLKLFDEYEKLLSSRENTRIATAIFIAAQRIQARMAPLKKDLETGALLCADPDARVPVTLDVISMIYDVKPQTVKLAISKDLSGLPGIYTDAVKEAMKQSKGSQEPAKKKTRVAQQ